jgi:UDP-glucuronate decarboxylase
MARILVLGGAGFIGYHLAERLSRASNAVTLVDDFSRGRMDTELEALVARPAVRFLRADLTDPAQLANVPRSWDQVYMLAAVVGVRNVALDPARVIRVNTLATLNVLEWLTAEAGVVFFASTSETYAGGVASGHVPVPTPENVPVSIDDIANPRFAYAATKIFGEAAMFHYARQKGFSVVVGRFHNVYGPRMGADHVIPELSLRALDREDPFRVYGAEQRRAFCHVADAVEAITRLAATEHARGQIVNVGNDTEETRVADLLTLILKIAKFSPRLDPAPAPPGSVERRCPDLTRLRALTGFTPKISLEHGVRETFDWYRARREGRQ